MRGMLWIVALCGVGTFLLRWLPLWRARHRRQSGQANATLQKWLEGVGPAAIAALLVVSVWGEIVTDIRAGRIAMVVLALGCIAAARWFCRGGIVVPTLAGAVAYGALSHFGV